MAAVYTFKQLKDAIRHALGGEPDSRITAGEIVGRAIDYVCNWHSWTWRIKTTTLSYVANTGQIPLPADFGEMIQLYGFGAKYTSVAPSDLHTILGRRVHGPPADGFSLSYCVVAATQAVNALSVPLRALEVAPIPTANMTDALYLSYRKLTPTFALTGTTDDLKYPDIPVGTMHTALYYACRGLALQEEEGSGGGDMAMAQSMLEIAKRADSAANFGNLGFMQGGGTQNYENEGMAWRPFTEIKTAYDP